MWIWCGVKCNEESSLFYTDVLVKCNSENGLKLAFELIFILVLSQMGDPNVEVTEEKMDEAQISKGKAVEAMSEGKHVRS